MAKKPGASESRFNRHRFPRMRQKSNSVIDAVAVGWLENLKVLSRSQKAFETAGGVLLILAGVYMLNAYFIFIPELAF